jgi:hypothetical protein
MIKYIKKLIKKQRLLRKYREQIEDYLFLLCRYRKGMFYVKLEKEMNAVVRCYNRLKKL